jgi:ATP-binding cassette subfamily F protein 3
VLRLQRVALIGPNGSGKTSFLKTIMGQQEPLQGRVRLGSSVILGYLAQMHAGLDPDKTVLDTILDTWIEVRGRVMLLEEARSYLGRFLFSGDDVFKPVGDLSGGERSRVALACLTLREANFLLLDEPTNHLDLATQEILEEVIREFPGTVLLVTHDRYLVEALATHVWALRDGRLHTYKGGYSAYLEGRAREKAQEAQTQAVESDSQPSDWREQTRAERRAQRLAERRAQERSERISSLEKAIEQQEAALASLGALLAQASEAQDVQELQELGSSYEREEAQLQVLVDQWAELAAESVE